MHRLLAVIDRRPMITAASGGEAPASVKGELALKGVVFAYPTRPDLHVLKRHVHPTGRRGDRPWLLDTCETGRLLMLRLHCLASTSLASSCVVPAVPDMLVSFNRLTCTATLMGTYQ